MQTLLEHKLIDELRLVVFPVILEKAKRLFGETTSKKPARLVDSRTIGSGFVILVYDLTE